MIDYNVNDIHPGGALYEKYEYVGHWFSKSSLFN